MKDLKFKRGHWKINVLFLSYCCFKGFLQYSTTFVVCIIAGMQPKTSWMADKECIAAYRRKCKAVTVWQRRWNQDDKERWAHRLFRHINAWVGRRHGQIRFYLTKFMSDYGYFDAYISVSSIRVAHVLGSYPESGRRRVCLFPVFTLPG